MKKKIEERRRRRMEKSSIPQRATTRRATRTDEDQRRMTSDDERPLKIDQWGYEGLIAREGMLNLVYLCFVLLDMWFIIMLISQGRVGQEGGLSEVLSIVLIGVSRIIQLEGAMKDGNGTILCWQLLQPSHCQPSFTFPVCCYGFIFYFPVFSMCWIKRGNKMIGTERASSVKLLQQ
ncbi:hypothetical protein TEA_015020 [Camellia sinensis var. sinensis]|uniref:Uncharacterized protein n=1 Tax=Camellia sinensis var. sinensis TaxID=542762 RepID=A0A4S4EXD8_CAMSN|nr:hypothetical protein TEA_015020 [Camellia sinensis var. sinensis]